MNKVITFATLIGIAASVSAAEVVGKAAVTNAIRRMTPEMRERIRQAKLKHTGGYIREANSAYGVFAVLNAQKRIPTKEIMALKSTLDNSLRVQMIFKDVSEVNVSNVADIISKVGGTVGVAVIEDDKLPMLVTAPETGWSIVNVSKIGEGASDDTNLASRVRKEIMRGLAFVSGGAYMTYADPLMRDVKKPRDLDLLQGENFGPEIIMHFRESSRFYGLKPWNEATYRDACAQGWAPAPTNEYQRAIWEKVHAPPEKPLKITYDKDKQKPVVK